jgi:nucleotide-binding universal stress UspA family protein
MTRTGETAKPAVAAPLVDVAYAAVLVPLDGSELAEQALGPARRLAGRFGAALHIVAADVQQDEAWWYQGFVDKLQQRLGELTLHVTDELAPARAIVARARQLEPCLVCMATHGRSRSAAIVGSTFAKVAARNTAPLIAVGPRAALADADTGASEHLVVCLDGSPAAERALPLAGAWARRLGWRVSIVTAADPVLLPRDYGFDPNAYLRDLAERPDFEGLTVDTQVLWGIAYPHISIGQHLDRHPADLVVATTRARTGFARAALGSEAARIIQRSPVPVLVQPLPDG